MKEKSSIKNDNVYIYQDEFEKCLERIVGHTHNDKGIGTISEKTVHGVLKLFLEPNEDNHEVAIEGYYADIYNEDGIIEIQTRQLNKLRDKLTIFLNYYKVTVVYPCPYEKWVAWVENDTGEVQSVRKSPKHYTEYDAFFELYKLKMYLLNPNFNFKIILMDMKEYRNLNGWDYKKKRGSTRIDRIPIGIRKIISIQQIEDYLQFVPYDLQDNFTSKDFAKHCKISEKTAGIVLNILTYVGAVNRIGKKGRCYLYACDVEQ